MGQIGRAAQVQRYLGIPVIQRHVAELTLGHFQRAAGVVDEDVHRAEVLDEIPHHPHRLLPAADVRAVNLCVHAVFAAFRRGLLRTGSVVVVVYADVAAVLREGDRRRRSYAVGCTRNKYVPAHLLQLSFIKLAVPDMLIRRIHCEEQFLRHSAAELRYHLRGHDRSIRKAAAERLVNKALILLRIGSARAGRSPRPRCCSPFRHNRAPR